MPILNAHSLEVISRSAEQTRRVGMRLGTLLQAGDTICLTGDLGSGKTTLVQGVATGWGSLDAVSSPTFVLVNVYRGAGGVRLYHLDAYRLASAAEAEELGLDDMLSQGPLVVEWADRIERALPREHLLVRMRMVDENQRDLVIVAAGKRYQRMLDELQRQIYGVR
jgi:tRNA threonylcarbamoyladenosine biosynthesis protein TsaE